MTMNQQLLNTLWKKGTDFLGTKYAIMAGAMSWVSERSLVSAISNAGGFGILACGAMTPELLEVEITQTQARTQKPFGVNLITMHPQLTTLIDVCIKKNVSHIILAGGIPTAAHIEQIKAHGIKVMCFAPALVLVKRLLKSGVDAFIIEGMEAGGHIGSVSTSVLAQEILPEVASQVPVFVAGGIGRGEAILSYLEQGACGVQLGTRFVCAHESIAHPNFKKAFIKAKAKDAQASVQLDPRLPVIPVRALKNKSSVAFQDFQRETIRKLDQNEVDLSTAQLDVEHFWAGALRKAVIEGDIENGSLMAGQSVEFVDQEESAQEIIDSLISQIKQGIDKKTNLYQGELSQLKVA